jgi:transketolase
MIPNIDVWRPATPPKRPSPGRLPSSAPMARAARLLAPEPAFRHAERRRRRHRRGRLRAVRSGRRQGRAIATGSEIKLALDAQAALAAEGIAVRVVSMPCTNVFDRQDAAYRSAVLGAHMPRIAIEAAHPTSGASMSACTAP